MTFEEYQQIIAQVEANKDEVCKSWRHLQKISIVALYKHPICTRYYFDEESKFPTFVLKIGNAWIKANKKLNELLADIQPEPPFYVRVKDSGRTTEEGYKIYDVTLEPIDKPKPNKEGTNAKK